MKTRESLSHTALVLTRGEWTSLAGSQTVCWARKSCALGFSQGQSGSDIQSLAVRFWAFGQHLVRVNRSAEGRGESSEGGISSKLGSDDFRLHLFFPQDLSGVVSQATFWWSKTPQWGPSEEGNKRRWILVINVNEGHVVYVNPCEHFGFTHLFWYFSVCSEGAKLC